MLGKGLESLIPPKKTQGQSDDPGVSQDTDAPEGENGASPSDAAREEEMPFMLFSHREDSGDQSQEIAAEKEIASGQPKAFPAAPAEHAREAPKTSGGKTYDAVFHIEVEKITPNPHQPRRTFDEESLRELANSIREFGILQPLVVTKVEKDTERGTDVAYQLIAGQRRLEAAKLLGLPTVPAIVRTIDVERERLEMAIIENLQRENLSPIEAARAFSRLADEFRLTQREIASRLGKSRETIANTVRLLDLPPYIQEAVDHGRISESHGRLLLTVTDPGAQQRLFNDLVGRRMTIRELKGRLEEAKPPRKMDADSPELKILQERLASALSAPVKISGGEEGGKITISFYSREELEHILARLKADEEESM